MHSDQPEAGAKGGEGIGKQDMHSILKCTERTNGICQPHNLCFFPQVKLTTEKSWNKNQSVTNSGSGVAGLGYYVLYFFTGSKFPVRMPHLMKNK